MTHRHEMLLEVSNLAVEFSNRNGNPEQNTQAVRGISLDVREGEIVGIVGESGSGKSTVALAVMGLLDRSRVQVSGAVRFEGTDLLSLTRSELRQYQGNQISMIFQEPMTSLNPVMRIGKQVEESLLIHTKMDAAERRARALESMAQAELPEPEAVYEKYPHQLSGGMRQRVMIAAALVHRPKLLIADEPTTALDVTIQAQIIQLLKKLNGEQGTAILFISHDLGVIRKLCSQVIVMHNGLVAERGEVEQIFRDPQEDYTKLLIASRPTRSKRRGGDRHV